MSLTPIFATLAWGFAPDTWGAIGFGFEKVRNELAADLRNKGGSVLTIGTMGAETMPEEQGRLLALHKVGTLPIRTEELVQPSLWSSHLRDNGGKPKWPFGLPIASAERFDDPQPTRRWLLPRLHDENLHMKLATNYVELTPDEANAVLAAPRTQVGEIWSTPISAFATKRLGRSPPGFKPSPGQRTLMVTSGPAATYCFALEGAAVKQISANIAPFGSDLRIYKIGFSGDPERRRQQLNAYLPDPRTLEWRSVMADWHADEINAWAMEQEIFAVLRRRGVMPIKGEIYALGQMDLLTAWQSAVTTAKRPTGSVQVTIGDEEREVV